MIQPQELRIGNRITVIGSLPTQVTAYHLYMMETYKPIDPNEADYKEMSQPIPLTEEWLLKFGFVLNDDGGDMKGNDRFWSRPGFLGSLSIPNLKHSTTGLYIRHVHQLQNLYFALTGQELNPIVRN